MLRALVSLWWEGAGESPSSGTISAAEECLQLPYGVLGFEGPAKIYCGLDNYSLTQ